MEDPRADAASYGLRRSAADVSTLLTELGRGWKGWKFYGAEHPARRQVLDRCWRAWHSDLARSGALQLEVRGAGFWLPEAELSVGQGVSADLAAQFETRSLDSVTWFPELDAWSLAAFLELLSTDPDEIRRAGGPERLFYAAPRLGIQLNHVDYSALREAALEDTAQVRTRPLGELESPPSGSEQARPLAPAEPPAAATQRAAEDPRVESDFHAAAAAELGQLLEELEDCDSDPHYRELALRLAALCEARVADGFLAEGFSVLATFARHAGDDAKRTATQRVAAHGCVERLGAGRLLEALIDRACSAQADPAVHGAEILLELGAAAVPSLLSRLAGSVSDPERARLTGVVLAMGEEAAAALADEIEAEDTPTRWVALRLAGKTQNPRLVPVLRSLLLRGGVDETREAARGLARIGNLGALEALVEAVQCPRASVASLAIQALGNTGGSLVVAPLTDALHRWLERDSLGLAREAVRALGRLGRPEAVPALAATLERGGFRDRKRLRDLKLASVNALASIPGEAAEQALARARRLRDRRVRTAVAAALARRASSPPTLGPPEGLP